MQLTVNPFARVLPRTLCKALLSSALLLGLHTGAHAADGLIVHPSSHSVADTLTHLHDVVTEKGMKVFARIDHAAGAAKIGEELAPTALLIFGNPKGGTPLMKCAQSFGIDLPLKALAWRDADGKVWLGVNDLEALAARHGASDCPAVPKVKAALGNLVKAALERR